MSHDSSIGSEPSPADEPAPASVVLRDESVQLYKILKFEGLVASGAEAKQQIADGQVTVNGRIETRKRCQIRPGDQIEFAGYRLLMVADSDPAGLKKSTR